MDKFFCGECEYSSKYPSNVNRHKKFIHGIGNIKLYPCLEKGCKYEAKSSTHLKRHKANKHGINTIWYHCGIDECKYKCKDKHSLKHHGANIHDIDVKIFKCDYPKCKFQCKQKGNLLNHQKIHEQDTDMFSCKHCDYQTRFKGNYIRHLSSIHDEVSKLFKCEICKEKFKTKDDINYHGAMVHDKNRKKFICKVDGCGYSSKYPGRVNRHERDVHETGIDIKVYPCLEKGCKYEAKSSTHLGRHRDARHKMGIEWYHCGIDRCKYKCNDKHSLEPHRASIHGINVKIFKCDYPGCKIQCNRKGNLLTHQKRIHGQDTKVFSCKHCNYQTESKENYIRHLSAIHNEGVSKRFKCGHNTESHKKQICTEVFSCKHCNYQTKFRENYIRHLSVIHNDVFEWFNCEFCNEKFKSNLDLDYHKAMVHDKHRERFICKVDGCGYSNKIKRALVDHYSYTHDMGDKECEICIKNVYRLHTYSKRNLHVCRVCYSKLTGKNSNSEKIMSKFLDKNYGTEFLICSDSTIKGEICQRYRPDKLYADPERVIHIECDEHQHSRQSSTVDYTCDEKRISDIYNEFPGKEYIVIRWNPHTFIFPEGKWSKEKKPKFDDRLEMLLQLLDRLPDIEFNSPITIIYMFYSPDNPLICQNFPKIMFYREEEIEEL